MCSAYYNGARVYVANNCARRLSGCNANFVYYEFRLRAFGNTGKGIVKIKTLMVDRFVIG